MTTSRKRSLLAVALVGALALAACGDDSGGKDAATTTTSTARRSTTTAAPTSTAPTRKVTDAVGTAKRWLAAVANGDDETAVALLSPRSLAKIGGADGYRRMKIELAEGWGAWGRAGDIRFTARTLPFPKDAAVVIVHGNVSQEGPPRESWNALPVVATDAGDRVEAFLDFGTISSNPSEGETLAEGDEVKITTATPSDIYVIVDDQPAFMPELRDVDTSGATWGFFPSKLEPGLHAVTVVVTREGIEAQRFELTVH